MAYDEYVVIFSYNLSWNRHSQSYCLPNFRILHHICQAASLPCSSTHLRIRLIASNIFIFHTHWYALIHTISWLCTHTQTKSVIVASRTGARRLTWQHNKCTDNRRKYAQNWYQPLTVIIICFGMCTTQPQDVSQYFFVVRHSVSVNAQTKKKLLNIELESGDYVFVRESIDTPLTMRCQIKFI